MNISPKEKIITCDCGHSFSMQDAEFYHCCSCQAFHFVCGHCDTEQTVPMGFNELINQEILKKASSPGPNRTSDDFADIFLGENQVPLTDELIEQLVEEGINREELLYMQKEGARYSTSRKSFMFPPEGDLDEIFE